MLYSELGRAMKISTKKHFPKKRATLIMGLLGNKLWLMAYGSQLTAKVGSECYSSFLSNLHAELLSLVSHVGCRSTRHGSIEVPTPKNADSVHHNYAELWSREVANGAKDPMCNRHPKIMFLHAQSAVGKAR